MKLLIYILLIFPTVILAHSSRPYYNLDHTITIKLEQDSEVVATPIEAIEKIDRLILKTTESLPIYLRLEIRETYKSFIEGKVPESAIQITTFTSAVNYHSNSNILGYAMPISYIDDDYFNGARVYVNKRLNVTPLHMRVTLIHELFSHFAHYLSLRDSLGPVVMGHVINGSLRGQEFWDFTHTTAALVEWQIGQMVNHKVFVEEIMASNMSEKSKKWWVEYYRKYYELPVKEFIKYKAQKERCPGEQCIGDHIFEKYFKHFKKHGFSQF